MTQDHPKSTMSKTEREARRAAVGRAASEKVSKSEQLNFRLERASIQALQTLSHSKGVPLGAMIRGWVLERLTQETLGMDTSPHRTTMILADVKSLLDNAFDSLGPQISARSVQTVVIGSRNPNAKATSLHGGLMDVFLGTVKEQDSKEVESVDEVSTWTNRVFETSAFRANG